jgi:hypothetical protein
MIDYFFDIIDESVSHTWSRQHVSDSNMHTEKILLQFITTYEHWKLLPRRTLKRIQVPTPLGQRVPQMVDVENIRANCHHGCCGFSKHKNSIQFSHPEILTIKNTPISY